jgi:hypothetical protein
VNVENSIRPVFQQGLDFGSVFPVDFQFIADCRGNVLEQFCGGPARFIPF